MALFRSPNQMTGVRLLSATFFVLRQMDINPAHVLGVLVKRFGYVQDSQVLCHREEQKIVIILLNTVERDMFYEEANHEFEEGEYNPKSDLF
ncbi:unnamed protein product, partial [Mesorhabditis belari]|uniref:Uncharacterized protein n=1 Tax=Mesorhabditis belari TaxID=2138241 RepID=A0AAF3J847_9BILA